MARFLTTSRVLLAAGVCAFVASAQAEGGALPGIDEPLRTGARAASDAAVVVGLEDYAFVPRVPYAGRDADAFATFLKYSRGVPPERVHVLKSGSRNILLRAIQAGAAEVGDGGTLWVYFAGHGAASTHDGSRILLADDVRQDPTAFQDAAVAVDEVLGVAATRGIATVLVLDTCYAGTGRSGESLVAGTRFIVPTAAQRPPPASWVWTAASGDQLSGPLDVARHGAFTYFAIGALRGWADGEIDGSPDGAVTLREANEYVARALREGLVDTQTPELAAPATGGEVVVVRAANLEPSPSLASLGLAGGADATLAQLEALKGRQAEREAAVAAASEAMRADASRVWNATAAIIAGGGPEAEVAIRQYIDRYEYATVATKGAPATVTIPEVAEAKIALARLAEGALSAVPADPTRLVAIDGGKFMMGSPPAEPGRLPNEKQHPVSVGPFQIATAEVTQFLYQELMGTSPSECTVAGCGARLPVQSVSYIDALGFCNALSARDGLQPAYTIRKRSASWNRGADGYRLPTEAEWEYAARAGNTRTFGITDDPTQACRGGNVAHGGVLGSSGWVALLKFPCTDRWPGLAPVGSVAPNAWGLYDMLGNVSEWVFDAYSDEPEGGSDPVVEDGKSRSFRGGSFNSIPRQTRVAFRFGIDPESASFERGFRVARSAGR